MKGTHCTFEIAKFISSKIERLANTYPSFIKDTYLASVADAMELNPDPSDPEVLKLLEICLTNNTFTVNATVAPWATVTVATMQIYFLLVGKKVRWPNVNYYLFSTSDF